MGAEKRAALIHEQTVIVEFERERAIEALPRLIPDAADRRRASRPSSILRVPSKRWSRTPSTPSRPSGAFSSLPAIEAVLFAPAPAIDASSIGEDKPAGTDFEDPSIGREYQTSRRCVDR